MYNLLFILIVILLVIKIFESKITIKFNTFFRRGFKKIDNEFGLVCYSRQTGKR